MRGKRELESIAKGVANHRRIEILLLLSKAPGLPIVDIADKLGIHFQNAAQHVAKLSVARLVAKQRDLNMVRHSLTPLGEKILRLLKQL